MSGLDDLLLSPVRLRICAYLSGCEEADHQPVQQYCGLTAANLSKQLSALEAGGYVAVGKVLDGRYTRTRLRLTEDGRAALAAHLKALRDLADNASSQFIIEAAPPAPPGNGGRAG